jgi:xanthosine utilization system XapX-like protein
MNMPNSQTILAAGALLILGALAGAMMLLPIPAPNATSLTFILGALAGALTVSGGSKIADKLTQSSGPGATIQPDAVDTHPQP